MSRSRVGLGTLPRRAPAVAPRAASTAPLTLVGIGLAGALATWLMAGTGFANYDAAYALVWGRDLAHLELPSYDVPVSPTPHPLTNLVGALLSPLGDGAEAALVVIAFLALGALGALTYALGARWFGRAAGALAAVIVLTRQPILSFGARAYLDIPYVVFVLAALTTEARRREGSSAAGRGPEARGGGGAAAVGSDPTARGGAIARAVGSDPAAQGGGGAAAAGGEPVARSDTGAGRREVWARVRAGVPAPRREAAGAGGAAVLAWLALAGLLRPEAWLFSAAYLAYLVWAGERDRRRLLGLAALAVAAPVVWFAADAVVTGDPLWSLTDTREGAQELGRVTGLAHVPVTAPRRLGEILREPVLFGAVAGTVLALMLMRDRLRLLLAAGALALAAFCVLALAGLPILGRYLFLPAVLLAILCGAGGFGWLALPPDHPWRGRARIVGIVVLLAQVPFINAQYDRLHELRGALSIQRQIRDDLHALVPALRAGCAPVAVPNHRPVPLLALWLERSPHDIVSAQLERITTGQYVDPASARVLRNFTLDKRDPRRLTAAVPPGFRRVGANRSWVLYARCARPAAP